MTPETLPDQIAERIGMNSEQQLREAHEHLDGWDIDAPWVDAACAAVGRLLEPIPDEVHKRAMKLAQAGNDPLTDYWWEIRAYLISGGQQ